MVDFSFQSVFIYNETHTTTTSVSGAAGSGRLPTPWRSRRRGRQELRRQERGMGQELILIKKFIKVILVGKKKQ